MNEQRLLPEEPERVKTTVKWFDGAKGYGFLLNPKAGGPDIFVHQTAIEADGYRSLRISDTVLCEVERIEDGRLRATWCKSVNNVAAPTGPTGG